MPVWLFCTIIGIIIFLVLTILCSLVLISKEESMKEQTVSILFLSYCIIFAIVSIVISIKIDSSIKRHHDSIVKSYSYNLVENTGIEISGKNSTPKVMYLDDDNRLKTLSVDNSEIRYFYGDDKVEIVYYKYLMFRWKEYYVYIGL